MKHRIIEILGLSGRRRIEVILPHRRSSYSETPMSAENWGPSTLAYAWALRTLGLKEPITHAVRRWQRTEPIAFLLAAAEGALLAYFLPMEALWVFLAATIQGILVGHF